MARHDTKPPVSYQQWVQQVNDDPSIPQRFKNGNEHHLELTDITFRSGSLLNSTEFLFLKTIWYPVAYVGSLGDMMKDDPETGWKGFVSAKNMRKAQFLFNEKRPLWEQFLNELREQIIQKQRDCHTPDSSLLQRGAVPRQPLRPSEDCGLLRKVLYNQMLVLQETTGAVPTTEEVERAYISPKAGDAGAEATMRLAVNKLIPPITPKLNRRLAGPVSPNPAQGTPEVDSYQPAGGGKFNQPAADEEFVNTALLSFIQSLNMIIGNDFNSLNWLGARLALRLSESVTTTNPGTGLASTEIRPLDLMEARVDGYLYRSKSPFNTKLNKIPLSIVEVKPFSLGTAVTAIRRQVGAEMASWISQAGDSTEGLLQLSESGRKRRPMFAQYRHEIYIIIGEYGPGFEAYIRPSRNSNVARGPAKKGSQATVQPVVGRVTTVSRTQDNSSGIWEPTLPLRLPGSFFASPASARRVESASIQISGDSGAIRRNPQPKQHPTGTRKSTRQATRKQCNPDPGDFLIMYEFGPFLTTDPSQMDLFIKRYMALMLEVRGPQDGFIPDTVSTKFLAKPELGEAVPCSGTTLKKAHSFDDEYKKPKW